jgi:N-acetyl-anhydromuramyl-L-alanine amidase AmpD
MRQWVPGLSAVPLLVALTSTAASAASSSSFDAATQPAAVVPALAASVDYPLAVWVPASTSNYSLADRPHDYPIDMIVIHDIEGSYANAIKMFQDPARKASSHYVISYHGQVTQMVAEKNIAWHAGNWDYNTRAIGIEHEGYAYTQGLYTIPEYRASAEVIATICSRWGVPMDRKHVIGHYQVPDPNHPGLFGGINHHTDPGPYWDWNYYIARAQYYASLLPSPPHMVLDATAFSGDGTATVEWPPARTCRTPIDHYVVVAQPGGIAVTVPGTATSAPFTGLTNGVNYSFTVTAYNSDGQDSLTSNTVTPGPLCTAASLSASPSSPQSAGVAVRFTAGSSVCANPQYQFSVQDSKGNWVIQQRFGRNSFSWDSYPYAAGSHSIRVWANHATGDPRQPESFAELTYELSPFSMTHWHATYDTSEVPTSWVAGRSQTFPVTVTNSGDVTWPSTGYGKVDLDLHFATSAGGAAKVSTWLNSKAFSMPADLTPGASVTFNVTWAPTSTTGSLVLEAEMIKEHQFWFTQWQPVAVNVAAPDRIAAYDMSKAPTSWVSGQSQTFPVTVTNTSTLTWLSTGYYRTDLGLHFATIAGGAAKQSTWLTSKAFSLPADVAPGRSATVNVTLAAPVKSGALVLEAEMIKEHLFWFQQWQPVNVTVAPLGFAASYATTAVPTTWVAGQSQTFPVTVTNTGNSVWPSTGYYRVDLDLHFATSAGGSAKVSTWLNSKAFSLPADLAPGSSVTLNVTFAAPSHTGALVLEAEMIKEHQFWFQQWAPVNVTVAAPIWSASYDLTGVPATWTKGQSQSVTVTVTNTGNQSWPSTGTNKVDLDYHFTTHVGGSAKQAYWLTSKAYGLPGDVLPGHSVTVTVAVVAPTTGAGSMFLEAEMIKEHEFWFTQTGAVAVTVS